jgi:hypothetical protein
MIACDVWHIGITQQWASKSAVDAAYNEQASGYADELAEDLGLVMRVYENDRDLRHTETITGKPWREVVSRITGYQKRIRKIDKSQFLSMYKNGMKMTDIAAAAGYGFSYVQKIIAQERRKLADDPKN